MDRAGNALRSIPGLRPVSNPSERPAGAGVTAWQDVGVVEAQPSKTTNILLSLVTP